MTGGEPQGRVPERAARAPGRALAHFIWIATIGLTIAWLAVCPTLFRRSPVADQTDPVRAAKAELRRAVLGSQEHEAPSLILSGFVADTGRLPRSLAELVSQPADLFPFDEIAAPAPFQEIRVRRGWRGPYLAPRTDEPVIVEGLANPLVFNGTDHQVSCAAAREPASSGGPPSVPVSVSFVADDWNAASVVGSVSIEDRDGSLGPAEGDWKVWLIGPGCRDTSDGVVAEPHETQSAPDGPQRLYSIQKNLTVGPKVLCVTKDERPVGEAVAIVLRPGATHLVDFRVRMPSTTSAAMFRAAQLPSQGP